MIIAPERPGSRESRLNNRYKELVDDANRLFDRHGSDSLKRETSHMPTKQGRPGLGMKGRPGFKEGSATLRLIKRGDGIDVIIMPADGETVGRPISLGSDFGEPESSQPEQYQGLAVRLEPDGVVQRMHGLLENGTWTELEGLSSGGGVRSPDAMLFAQVCVDYMGIKPEAKTTPDQLGGQILHLAV